MVVLTCPVQMPLQILHIQVATKAYHEAISEAIHNREKLILLHCEYPILIVKRDAMPASKTFLP